LTPNNRQRPSRKSPRLKDYDYSQNGAYFVTICTKNRLPLFGNIRDGEMHTNVYGDIVWACWEDLVDHYNNIELDAFVVMPNHVHGIVLLYDMVVNSDDVGEGFKPSPTTNALKRHGLPEIVRGFKTFSARRINERRNSPGESVWQRSYHDRIIRHEAELNRLRDYVLTNPARWVEDSLYAVL